MVETAHRCDKMSISRTRIRKELIDIGIAVAIFLLIQGIAYAYLEVFPPYRVVSSGSMEPTYKQGDVVFIKKVDPHTLDVGDVIVFKARESEIPIIHRVINIVEEGNTLYFVTKGDNNCFQDTYYHPLPGVPESEVVGTAVLKIPKVGWLSILFRRLLWRLFG